MTAIDIYLYENAQAIFLTHIVNDEIETFILCPQEAEMNLGDLYLGQIQRLERGRAWVDIGLSKAALLSKSSKDLKVTEKICVCIERIPSQELVNRERKGPLVSQKILENIQSTQKIGRLRQAPSEWQRYLKSFSSSLNICTNREHLFHHIKEFSIPHHVFLKSDLNLPSFIKRSWQDLYTPYVNIPEGGWILIEEGETLTAIDVNTSDEDIFKAKGIENDRDLYEFSKRAWTVIRQSIIHRQIGGIIVIDFPRFRNKSFQDKLYKEMTLPEATLFGFTPGGLFEITRRKKQDSLSRRLEILFKKGYIFDDENH